MYFQALFEHLLHVLKSLQEKGSPKERKTKKKMHYYEENSINAIVQKKKKKEKINEPRQYL